MTALLLDTHVLVWTMGGSRRLGSRTVRAISRAAERGDVLVSAVSSYEIARLIEAGRLPRRFSAWEIRERALKAGLTEVAVNGEQALDAAGLLGLSGDPMDRFIVAAARHARATLVTADEAILGWEGKVERLDARE